MPGGEEDGRESESCVKLLGRGMSRCWEADVENAGSGLTVTGQVDLMCYNSPNQVSE